MISPQLLNAFVECSLELEDLALVPDRSPDEEKEYRHLLDEFGAIFTRMVFEATKVKNVPLSEALDEKK